MVEDVDLQAARKVKEAELAKQHRIALEKRVIAQREAQRNRNLIVIAIGNLVMLMIGILAWRLWLKRKAKKEDLPEMQLKMPKN